MKGAWIGNENPRRDGFAACYSNATATKPKKGAEVQRPMKECPRYHAGARHKKGAVVDCGACHFSTKRGRCRMTPAIVKWLKDESK